MGEQKPEITIDYGTGGKVTIENPLFHPPKDTRKRSKEKGQESKKFKGGSGVHTDGIPGQQRSGH